MGQIIVSASYHMRPVVDTPDTLDKPAAVSNFLVNHQHRGNLSSLHVQYFNIMLSCRSVFCQFMADSSLTRDDGGRHV